MEGEGILYGFPRFLFALRASKLVETASQGGEIQMKLIAGLVFAVLLLGGSSFAARPQQGSARAKRP